MRLFRIRWVLGAVLIAASSTTACMDEQGGSSQQQNMASVPDARSEIEGIRLAVVPPRIQPGDSFDIRIVNQSKEVVMFDAAVVLERRASGAWQTIQTTDVLSGGPSSSSDQTDVGFELMPGQVDDESPAVTGFEVSSSAESGRYRISRTVLIGSNNQEIVGEFVIG